MTDTTPDYAGLIERLEKVEPDTPGEGVTRYYRNPDGPEAAAAFRTLLSRAEAAEAERDRLKERVTELEDLCNSLEAQAAELAAVKEMYAREGAKALYELERAEAAEAKLAEAMKALDALDRVNRGVDWCDQDEQARRWSAARRALEGGE